MNGERRQGGETWSCSLKQASPLKIIVFIHSLPPSLPSSLPSLLSGIAKLSINRPSLRNAFRPTTIRELKRCMALAQDDLQVGVIILTGRQGGREDREGGPGALRNAFFRPTTIRELKHCMALAQDNLQVGVIILTDRWGGEGREGGKG